MKSQSTYLIDPMQHGSMDLKFQISVTVMVTQAEHICKYVYMYDAKKRKTNKYHGHCMYVCIQVHLQFHTYSHLSSLPLSLSLSLSPSFTQPSSHLYDIIHTLILVPSLSLSLIISLFHSTIISPLQYYTYSHLSSLSLSLSLIISLFHSTIISPLQYHTFEMQDLLALHYRRGRLFAAPQPVNMKCKYVFRI